MAQEKSENESSGDDNIIETAKKRYQAAEEFARDNYKEALADWRFRAGEQWPEQIRREREAEGRPTITVNRILPPIRQVTNDQRQNRPSIKVHPVDDLADIETAKIIQGIVRHIEQDSNADVAYDTGFEGGAVGGVGWIRVITEYIDPMSFEQKLKIGMVEDFATVKFDPSSKEPDGSDANWAFIEKDIPKQDFIDMYGESKLAEAQDWSELGRTHGDWVMKDSCRVVEYFYKEYKSVAIAQLSSGEVVEQSKLDEIYPGGIPKGLVVNKKTAKVPVIQWCKLNGVEILEKTTWLGKWIPIIPVYGDKYVIEGKRYLEGIVRQAKDACRMSNYWDSTATELITLAPKAPWVVAEGQIPKQYQAQWQAANRKSFATLTYKPTTHEGLLVPPPQRNVFDANVQSITQAGMQSKEDVKVTTGIYDASLGRQSNEISGIAIQRRNLQAQTSNYHLIDNLTRSIRHVGRILVDLIPKVYDTARAARIIGEEGEEEIVRINQVFERKGEPVEYRLGYGEYDVSVDTGPNFATKRQEAAASMLELSKNAPSLMAVAPDLIVKNLDIPGGQEIAERLRKTLPPGIAESKDQKPVPPEVQAQLQQMSQMIEQLTNELNGANETIKTKKMDIDSKVQIEAMKLETQLLIEKMKQSQALATMQVERQLAQLDQIQNTGIESLGPDQAEEQHQPAGVYAPSAEEQV